jgi:prepilin-type processing-associated H-X9-DG protein
MFFDRFVYTSLGGSSMKKCILAVCLTVLAATLVRAQPLADRVPEDAIIYFGWSGADSLPAEYQGSHLKSLLEQSNIPRLFSEFLPAVMERIADEDVEAGQALEFFRSVAAPMWKHPTVFYFSGMDWKREEPLPRMALLCQAGPDAQAVHDALIQLLAQAGNEHPLQAFRSGDLVGIYAGFENERAALAGEGGTAKPLNAHGSFEAAMGRMQIEPVLILYADLESGLAQVDAAVDASGDEQAGEIWPKIRAASGLAGAKRLIFVDGFDGRDWGSRGFMEAPAPRSGLLGMLDTQPLSDELLKVIPQSATMVFAGKFDPSRFLNEIRSLIGEVDPDARGMFDKGMGAAQLMLGRNLQRDILEPLGEDWAIYLSPKVAGNGISGLVVVNRLDDAKRAEQGLVSLSLFINNMIAGQLRGEEMTLAMKNTKIDGMTVWYFAVPLVAPSWGIRDGNLYMGLYPQSVGAASRFAASGEKSFLDNEKYIALRQRLDVQQPRAVRFMDLPELAGPGYQLLSAYLRLGLGFADMMGVEAPEPVLPALDRVLAHLSPSGSLSWVDAEGWHLRGVSPFPGSGVLAGDQTMVSTGAAAMMVGVMVPSLNRARETANRVKCASNMRQLGQGILLYSNDNRGKYPPDYATLVSYMLEMGIDPAVLLCPSGHSALPRPAHMMAADEIADWAERHSSYAYVGAGKRNDAGFGEVILYERPGPHGRDGINMLFGDGHVEFQRMPAAEKLLQEQGIAIEYATPGR